MESAWLCPYFSFWLVVVEKMTDQLAFALLLMLALCCAYGLILIAPRKSDRMTSAQWWAWYDKYLQSRRWRITRAVRLWLAGYRCALWRRGGCGGPLQVHHKNYRNVAKEFPFHLNGLQVLCRNHHKDVTK